MDYLVRGMCLKEFIVKPISSTAAISLLALTFSSGLAAEPMNSIADSWHNLGAGNTKGLTPNGDAPANHSLLTEEICVFCHTPHGGDNSASVPIWNRQLNSPGVYKRYSELGTSTFDAEEVPVGSVSIACLSCHDGTQALDSLINWPGSGTDGDVGIAIPGFRMTGADLDGDNSLKEGIVQNLGVDLSNDHPIGMQYAGGGITAGDLFAPTRDPDFTAAANEPNPQGFTLLSKSAPSGSSISTLWWIERGVDSMNDSDRDREDIILYTRNELNAEQPFVECGSCHDPHNIENPTFLRVANGVAPAQVSDFPSANGSPSGLCLSCHLK